MEVTSHLRALAAVSLAGLVFPLGSGLTGVSVRLAMAKGRGCGTWRVGGAVIHLLGVP